MAIKNPYYTGKNICLAMMNENEVNTDIVN